jgi:Ion channel
METVYNTAPQNDHNLTDAEAVATTASTIAVAATTSIMSVNALDDVATAVDEPDGIMKQKSSSTADHTRSRRSSIPTTTTGMMIRSKRRPRRQVPPTLPPSQSPPTIVVNYDDSQEDDENDDDDDEYPHVATNWKRHPENDEHSMTTPQSTTVAGPVVLTKHDVAMCQALDMEFERAIEERQVAWTARYQSVRQSTFLSVLFMVLLIFTGTIFFLHQADSYWSISEALLFSIYTITTVGYGHLDMPDTAIFQWYTICYIFLGIAMLTMLVAQVYQCVALETSRVAVNAGDVSSARRHTSMRRWLDARVQEQRRMAAVAAATTTATTNVPDRSPHDSSHHTNGENSSSTPRNSNSHDNNMIFTLDHQMDQGSVWDWADVVAWLLQQWDTMVTFLRDNEYGRGLSVILPFLALIIIGAVVIGPLEGWTITESIYFAVVSLTTVGFGDYYPTRNASIWFCCLWLPFSVGFMSLYLSNVAAFYIRLSDRNIARIEGVLRRRLRQAKEKAEQERRAVLQRAMRGQQLRRGSSIEESSTDDDIAMAMYGSETEMRKEDGPIDVSSNEQHLMLSKTKNLRVNTKRFSGFNTIPTEDGLEDSVSAENPLSPDSFPGDSKSKSNGAGSSRNRLFGSRPTISHRRERILGNSLKHMEFAPKHDEQQNHSTTMTMTTMKDVLRSVHRNNSLQRSESIPSQTNASIHSSSSKKMSPKIQFQSAGPESEFLSIRSNRTVLHHDSKTVRKKPSFALRALVQERFAEIIATDIAGFHNSIEIKEYTLSVTIEAMKKTADKWLIPRRARKSFRAVAFEALYFVGEHGLITRGADALFSLTPIEFHQIFSPLLASFGDAETMELWLEHTQALADVDLPIPLEKQRQVTLSASAISLRAPPVPSNSQHDRSVLMRSLPPLIVSVPSLPDDEKIGNLPVVT